MRVLGEAVNFFPPADGVSWQTCLVQLVSMWKTVVEDECELCNERGSTFSLPCIVVFSKLDVLDDKDEAAVTEFKSHCRMVCLRDLNVDGVSFISLLRATSSQFVDVQTELQKTIEKRLETTICRQARRQSVILSDTRSHSNKERKFVCCGA